MKQPSLFILGNPRSGTTVLRLSLSSHNNICVPPEGGFALWLEKQFIEQAFPVSLEAFIDAVLASKKFETWSLSKQTIMDLADVKSVTDYSSAVELVYQAYAKKIGKSNCRVIGDKNNFYTGMVGSLYRLFTESKVLWITRDPRDVFCSYKELKNRELNSKYAPNLEQDPEKFALEWCDVMEHRKEARTLFGSGFCAIRYEDLVSNPEKSLTRVSRFLGLEYDPQMLEFHKQSDEPESFLAWKEKTKYPFSNSQVGRYQRDLSSHEISVIESVAGDYMALVDY